MPIDDIQSEVLKAIARHRDPESFVAGGVPINRDGPRFSKDIDIFHDRKERVLLAADQDAATLATAGFEITWLRRLDSIVGAGVSKGGVTTKLEWVADSDFRYFPALADAQFGFVLSIADLAVNKLMAAVGRREPRDVVDLLTLHETYLPLGAIAWASVEVAPGFTPEGLLAELRRNTRYCADDFRRLAVAQPIDIHATAQRIRRMIDAAEAFVAQMPSEKAGRLFLLDGHVVQPDPANLAAYVEHAPARRGHWPTSPDIERAMLERYLTGNAAPK